MLSLACGLLSVKFTKKAAVQTRRTDVKSVSDYLFFFFFFYIKRKMYRNSLQRQLATPTNNALRVQKSQNIKKDLFAISLSASKYKYISMPNCSMFCINTFTLVFSFLWHC